MTVVGSIGDETTIVDQWVTATLTGDTATTDLLADGANGVHADIAPPGAGHPLIVFQFQGGFDVRGAGPHRIMLSGLWLIRAIGECRDYLQIKPIADRIDALFQGTDGTADGGFVFSSVREQPFRLAEHDDGHDYRHLGGIYRCLAQLPAT